jgi:RNA polymerase sigma-70 factor (ECF subfamily)
MARILKDTLVKALHARAQGAGVDNLEGWLFRIAHNASLDFLRRRTRGPLMESEEDLDMIANPDIPDSAIAETCLRSFMHLPALQRSAVILKDVLGHSLEEAAVITGSSEPAIKSALQRGREQLR